MSTPTDLTPTSTSFSAEYSAAPAFEAVLEVLAGQTVVGTFHLLSLTERADAGGMPHRVAVAVQAAQDSRARGDDRVVHVLTGSTLHPDAEWASVPSIALMTLASTMSGVLAFIDAGGPAPGTSHPWASSARGPYPTLPPVPTPLGVLHRIDLDAWRAARENRP